MTKLLASFTGAALFAFAAAAGAQTPPDARDLEPGVNTSAPPNEPANAPRPEGSRDLEPGVNTSAPDSAPPAAASVPAGQAGTQAAPPRANNPAATGRGAQDRLELDATQITGNRELPKVMYIVPWRGAELGDLVGRPVNSLLDEVLEPVDRDVFRRQNRYFEALQPNDNRPAGKPEK